MLTKTTRRFPLRIALLVLALVLTGLAMVPPATAVGCTPGQKRTIWVDPHCCADYDPPPAPVHATQTAQDQVCCFDGTWVNDGAPYCKTAPLCML